MFSKIKSILFCIIFTICGNMLNTYLQGDTPDFSNALLVGGVLGTFSAAAIALICKERHFFVVGVASTLAVWFAIAWMLLDAFGLSGLDLNKFVITTFFVATLGVYGALGYKLGKL